MTLRIATPLKVTKAGISDDGCCNLHILTFQDSLNACILILELLRLPLIINRADESHGSVDEIKSAKFASK